ncbi:MAG: homocitrate synthase [Acidimicrobiaceae bacterium]|nr:homocitrate synthase [Acidimicrobiaceae bacterium]|tara:strand:+ start:78970 stop:80028 length:1059 start_codon:yes stop_codon:yes gene_type:complete
MRSMENHLKVCVIPGDDAAPEAIYASVRVLEHLDLPIEFDFTPSGTDLLSLSKDEREDLIHSRIDESDTALFGASNGNTPGAGYMRWGKDTFANVRPIHWQPGFNSPLRDPSGIDYVIVRENLEDMYVGVMGEAKHLLEAGLADRRSRIPSGANEGRFAAKIITRPGTEQVARFACELAMQREASLTVSAKTNMLPATDKWFCDIVREIAEEYPGLDHREFIIDDMAHRLVVEPHDLDVLLLPNLYGDILSDLGAGTVGGLGLAPSGCYGNNFAYFESSHGTAPDLEGRGVINPTATLLSASMMLRYLNLEESANRLETALAEVYRSGAQLTPDQGGSAPTERFAEAVIGEL